MAEENVVATPEATADVTTTTTETTAPVETTNTSTAEAAPSLDEELLDVWVKNNVPGQKERTRAPDGKFAPTPKDALTQEHKPQQAAQQAKQPTAPAAKVDRPYSWSSEMKAKLGAVPPDVVAYAAKRDREQMQAISKAGEVVKQYEQALGGYRELDQLVEHYQQDFIRRGISPVQAFATLLNAQATLDRDPREGLTQIAATYGMDIRPFLYGPNAMQQQPDPVAAQLNERIVQLQQQLQAVTGTVSQREQAAAQAEEQARAREMETLHSEIDTFSTGKPFFEDVKPMMAALLRSGQAQGLPDAYDMAVNAHPQVRSRIQQDQRAKEEAARANEAKQKAEAARRAASVNVRGGPSGTSPRSIDDTIRDAARRLYS